VTARADEIDDTLHEIERELHRRLDLEERIVIGFALDRFADRVADDTLHEIGRELHRRLDLEERIAIRFAPDRFADRVAWDERDNHDDDLG
jgi:hypothetical protein